MIKGVLFDFNGVLLLDTKWHEEAWDELSMYLRKTHITKEESEQFIHGATPYDTLAFLLGRPATSEETKELLDRKEKLYQDVTLSHGTEFKLNDGAIALFEMLEANGISKTIATSSPWVNLEFYYKYLGLEKWFPIKNTVYGDGIIPGKPAPDIFLKAAKNIGQKPEDCLVIEDANSGVNAAKAAGAGKIIFLLNADNLAVSQKVSVTRIVKSLADITMADLA